MINFQGLLARSHPLPTPIAPPIILSHNARTDLHPFIRAHATPPSLGLRARIVFRAADVDRPTTLHISRELGCDNRTAGTWRRRDLALGFPGLHEALRSGRPQVLAPPTRVPVLAVASAFPHDHDRTVTRWTLEEIVATWLDALGTAALSRSSLWRLLHEVDRKPHKSAYGWHSHEADGDVKAPTICPLDAQALASSQHGRLVICCEEKTGRHVLERTAPTQPAQPGRRERRAQADRRHGTRVLINSWAVATGQMAWTIGSTRQATDCVAHLTQASQRLPRMHHDDWIMDKVHTHWRLDVCGVVARWGTVPLEPAKLPKGIPRRAFLSDPTHRPVLHCTPKQGSWLHHAAWFFGVVPRRFLARGSCTSAKDFARRLERLLKDYNTRHAHPYRWT